MWSIGIYTGDSPYHLSSAQISNPVLTAESVTDIPAAFVADPFILKGHMFFEVLRDDSPKGEIGLAQAAAAYAFGLGLPDLQARNRTTDRARQLAMYLARMSLKLGARETARGFGRNHRAVVHACRRIEEAREDPAFDRTVEWLEMLVRRAARGVS